MDSDETLEQRNPVIIEETISSSVAMTTGITTSEKKQMFSESSCFRMRKEKLKNDQTSRFKVKNKRAVALTSLVAVTCCSQCFSMCSWVALLTLLLLLILLILLIPVIPLILVILGHTGVGSLRRIASLFPRRQDLCSGGQLREEAQKVSQCLSVQAAGGAVVPVR